MTGSGEFRSQAEHSSQNGEHQEVKSRTVSGHIYKHNNQLTRRFSSKREFFMVTRVAGLAVNEIVEVPAREDDHHAVQEKV